MLLWWVCRGVGWFYGGFERTVGAFMVGLYRWLMFFFFLFLRRLMLLMVLWSVLSMFSFYGNALLGAFDVVVRRLSLW